MLNETEADEQCWAAQARWHSIQVYLAYTTGNWAGVQARWHTVTEDEQNIINRSFLNMEMIWTNLEPTKVAESTPRWLS